MGIAGSTERSKGDIGMKHSLSRRLGRLGFWTACLGVLALTLVLSGCNGDNAGLLGSLQLRTLSNRADLISGGDVLVEVRTPADSTTGLTVSLNGADVTNAFAKRPDGRITGLVTGLKTGANTLMASQPLTNGTQLTITNAPRGGPVLLSTQTTPWVCATPAPQAASGSTPATNASGLSTTATDAQCNIKTEFKLFYRTKTPVSAQAGDGGCSFVLPDPSPTAAVPNPTTPANSCLQPYVQGTTPAAAVAMTTTTTGASVPYIVRVERGTINRGIYDIAVLFDPAAPAWTATTPQPQWNRKVVISYGASTGQPRLQFRTEQNWADDTALSRGFMVVDNSLTDSLYNSNRMLAAETTIMMKEHIVDSYGEILFTMGNGCSGGSIGQNTVSSIFPGLLDGIQPSCDYPDSITTGMEVTDCVLLANFYQSPQWVALTAGLTQEQINARKTAINGHLDHTACHGWYNLFGSNNQPGNYTPIGVVNNVTGALGPIGVPKNNCLLPAALVYDPVTNPSGTRCGDSDLAAMVWGTTAGVNGGTRALQTTDNVGIQYGLKALLAGKISPEEFVTLNETIGGTDPDSRLAAARSTADLPALDIAYKAGIVGSGKNFGKVAIIDSRGYDEVFGNPAQGQFGIHQYWRSYAQRARLDTQAGSHANQVIWRYGFALTPVTPPQIAAVTTQSFLTMDAWLSKLFTDAPKSSLNDEHTQAQVIAAKPASAVDLCFLSTDVIFANRILDPATCDADPRLVPHASPRQVAGGSVAENILKCQLKPLSQADYAPVTFTAPQFARLQAAFASGVCDWSKPGVGQTDPTGPLTFKAGAGGQPLGPVPTSAKL
jgi:hypothetical protein